jgi:hypothetical protein
MVSKKTIYGLDFATLEDYFIYIIDSKTNGQQKQAKQLYKDLSTRQKNNFIMYLTQIYTAQRTNEIIKYLM